MLGRGLTSARGAPPQNLRVIETPLQTLHHTLTSLFTPLLVALHANE
jgi:hypothetical protein